MTAPSWTPLHFILYGEYCPPQNIREWLVTLRDKASAEGAFLFAYRRASATGIVKLTDFYRSLYMVSHRNDPIQDSLQRLDITSFASGLIKSNSSQFVQEVHLPPHGACGSLRDQFPDFLQHNPGKDMEKHFGSHATALVLRDTREHTHAARSPWVGSPLVILMNPTPERIAATLEAWSLHELDFCLTAINASAGVASRRLRGTDQQLDDFATGRHLDEKLRQGPFTRRGLLNLVKEVAKGLLEQAVVMTASDQGAFYLAETERGVLHRAAQISENKSAFPSIVKVDSSSPSDPRHPIVEDAWSEKQFRARVINDIQEVQRIFPGLNDPPSRVITVNILQRNFHARFNTAFGVIIVQKARTNPSRAYSHHDFITVVRIAWRFCAWRARILAAWSSQQLSRLTQLNLELPKALMLTRPKFPLSNSGQKEIPEAVELQYLTRESLGLARYLTRSLVVSLRLLSTDTRRLVRICGWPEIQKDVNGEIIEWRTHQVLRGVKDVIITGQESYVPNVPDAEEEALAIGLSHMRENGWNVHSMIMVPVFVGQRIVGTLFLASNYRDAYDETRPLLRAIADQIGLALARIRMTRELNVIYKMLALQHELTNFIPRWHESVQLLQQMLAAMRCVQKCAPELVGGNGSDYDNSPSLHNRLGRIGESFTQLDNGVGGWSKELSALRDEDNALCDYCPVVDLFNHLVAEERGRGRAEQVFSWRNGEPDGSFQIPAAHAPYFTGAWREIIRNAHAHDRLPMLVNVSRIELGGRLFARFSIVSQQEAKSELDDDRVQGMFRTMYDRPGKNGKGLGMFLAGHNLRALGGDGFAFLDRQEADFPRLVICVDIPYAPEVQSEKALSADRR